MASPEITTSLATLDNYELKVTELDQMGRRTDYAIALPTNADFDKYSMALKVAVLKGSRENPGPWSKYTIPNCYVGIIYAERFGLDVLAGDVFPTGEGRWGTSNKAKTKMALRTGNVVGIETDMKELATPGPAGCVLPHDYLCTVTIHVKGWTKPIIKKQTLTQWYAPKNAAWQRTPLFMLEQNTIGHACELVNPTITEADEYQPVVDTLVEERTKRAADEMEFQDNLSSQKAAK